MDRLSDNDLLHQSSFGNVQSFKLIMDRYMSMVFRNAFRITCDRSDAEAVSRAVFTALWDGPGSVPDDFRNWLIGKICFYSRLRMMRWRLLWVFNIRKDVFVMTSRIMDADNDYEAKQAWQLYCRASSDMTPLQRMCFSLCVLEMIDPKDVASVLNISGKRLDLAVSRASRKIRSELAVYGKENLYSAYVAFIRKVADDGSDTDALERNVLDSIGS